LEEGEDEVLVLKFLRVQARFAGTLREDDPGELGFGLWVSPYFQKTHKLRPVLRDLNNAQIFRPTSLANS
jgi:hypothetical protein